MKFLVSSIETWTIEYMILILLENNKNHPNWI